MYSYLLFSSLKVTTVQELPAKFVPPKLSSHQHEEKMEDNQSSPRQKGSHSHKHITEDTAATPPTYKYDKAKEVSLDESLTLQKSQKVKQDVSL